MENVPRRIFESPENKEVRNMTVKASQLERGDYSASHDRKIERVYTQNAGQQVVVVFEQTDQQRRDGMEGTAVFLDADDSLEITRGREGDPY